MISVEISSQHRLCRLDYTYGNQFWAAMTFRLKEVSTVLKKKSRFFCCLWSELILTKPVLI